MFQEQFDFYQPTPAQQTLESIVRVLEKKKGRKKAKLDVLQELMTSRLKQETQ